jgi:hypothetical protein
MAEGGTERRELFLCDAPWDGLPKRGMLSRSVCSSYLSSKLTNFTNGTTYIVYQTARKRKSSAQRELPFAFLTEPLDAQENNDETPQYHSKMKSKQ